MYLWDNNVRYVFKTFQNNGKLENKTKIIVKTYWVMPYLCIINKKLSENKECFSFNRICMFRQVIFGASQQQKTKSGSQLFYDIL